MAPACIAAQVAVLVGVGVFRRIRKYRELESALSQSKAVDVAKRGTTRQSTWDEIRQLPAEHHNH